MDASALGSELRRYVLLYARTKKRQQKNVYLGMAIGMKRALDLMGEAVYANQCVREAEDELRQQDRPWRRGGSPLDMLM